MQQPSGVWPKLKRYFLKFHFLVYFCLFLLETNNHEIWPNLQVFSCTLFVCQKPTKGRCDYYSMTCIIQVLPRVDLLYFKQGADVGIDIIITLRIVDFGIDQVGETCFRVYRKNRFTCTFDSNFLKTSEKWNHGFLKKFSPTGNWTPVSRVTGGDTHHYTIEDVTLKYDIFFCITHLFYNTSCGILWGCAIWWQKQTIMHSLPPETCKIIDVFLPTFQD